MARISKKCKSLQDYNLEVEAAKSEGLPYRITVQIDDNTERRAIRWTNGKEVEYDFRIYHSLGEVVDELGEDFVFRMFKDSWSTYSDQNALNPSKKAVKIQALQKLVDDGKIDEKTMKELVALLR